ncbi:hypothetical protein K7432_001088 [Basidiobolus ranarum]|uniref:Uncharacterized protein n=1 Tax=Basidiobolus ranarum TaxID=34480 RepID=A0ABR2X3M8_9FUNG
MLASGSTRSLNSKGRCSINKGSGGWFFNGEASIVSEVSQVVCNETITINSGSSHSTIKPRLRKYKSIDLLSKCVSSENERKPSLRRMASIDVLHKYLGLESPSNRIERVKPQHRSPTRLSEYVTFPLHDEEFE